MDYSSPQVILPFHRSCRCALADWHLYVVRTLDHCLYTGISIDVPRRVREHMVQGRKTAKYLLAHKPKDLAFSWAVGEKSLALKVEYHFKRLSRPEKERILDAGRLRFERGSGRIEIPEGA
jgi:putative endonuclease